MRYGLDRLALLTSKSWGYAGLRFSPVSAKKSAEDARAILQALEAVTHEGD